ncbi:cupin domain-containing protein [Streptomyces sp. NPDC051985]|uniref:cupin domain-containing protein n=1 Tax=Streptomyces sp. NPDC051985 TaxID=3155807 RepID=UPI0034294976
MPKQNRPIGGSETVSSPVRRVVTGQTAEGVSVFTHVEEVAGLTGAAGQRSHFVWGWADLPTLPHHDTAPYTPVVKVERGGIEVIVVDFPPGFGVSDAPGTGREPATGQGRADAINVHRGGDLDPRTGMHCSDAVDIGFVISGELGLEEGDGTEVTLRVGDVFVQHGDAHAWHNRTGEPCRVGFVSAQTVPFLRQLSRQPADPPA